MGKRRLFSHHLSAGAVVKVFAAAPFKICYYSFLTGSYTGWRGLAIVYAFFLLGAALQRCVPT